MPEGHTVHRAARDLRGLLGQRLAVSSPQGRFAREAALLDGTVLEAVEPFGKHLFLHASSGDTVHVHLGMQGKWLRAAVPDAPPLKGARLRLQTAGTAWHLVAPTTCELLDDRGVAAVTATLGPDPLRDDAAVDTAVAALAADPRAVGTAVLDQAVLAGVGNVFRAEALHVVGVAPQAPSSSLGVDGARRLWEVLRAMMSRAVDDGRIITVDGPDRLTLPESETRKVYKQEHCRDCGAPVSVGTVGSRTAYWCPVEQPG